MRKSETKPKTQKLVYPKGTTHDIVRNAMYTIGSIGFTPDRAMELLNGGMLGYQLDDNGKPKMKAGKKIPVTISRTSYYRYRIIFSEIPEAYKYLREFAMRGYTQLCVGFQEELAVLHRLSIENLMDVKDPLERQQVIDSLVKNVIPTQSAFADMLKEMIADKKEIMEETVDEPENDT